MIWEPVFDAYKNISFTRISEEFKWKPFSIHLQDCITAALEPMFRDFDDMISEYLFKKCSIQDYLNAAFSIYLMLSPGFIDLLHNKILMLTNPTSILVNSIATECIQSQKLNVDSTIIFVNLIPDVSIYESIEFEFNVLND